MGELVIQESECHAFLVIGHICRVPSQNIYISSEVLPVCLTPGIFEKTSEQLRITEPAHHPDIMIYRAESDLIDDRFTGEQRSFLLLRLNSLRIGQEIIIRPDFGPVRYERIDTTLFHVVLKIMQLVVDPDIPVSFGFIHIIQLAEDDIESLFKAVEMNDLSAVLSRAFGSEICVDQQQRLNRQILQLQIPYRVIGGNMSDPFQAVVTQAVISIVIVQIRNPSLFMLSASVLAYVMGSCGG